MSSANEVPTAQTIARWTSFEARLMGIAKNDARFPKLTGIEGNRIITQAVREALTFAVRKAGLGKDREALSAIRSARCAQYGYPYGPIPARKGDALLVEVDLPPKLVEVLASPTPRRTIRIVL